MSEKRTETVTTHDLDVLSPAWKDRNCPFCDQSRKFRLMQHDVGCAWFDDDGDLYVKGATTKCLLVCPECGYEEEHETNRGLVQLLLLGVEQYVARQVKSEFPRAMLKFAAARLTGAVLGVLLCLVIAVPEARTPVTFQLLGLSLVGEGWWLVRHLRTRRGIMSVVEGIRGRVREVEGGAEVLE